MTAVVDRLAAIIAEHRLQGGLDRYRCTCGAATAKGLGARAWRERHLAAVIASADDLAVVSLPKPDDKEGAVWRLDPAAKPGYPDGSYVRTRHWPAGTRIGAHGVADMRVPDAERAAAALLAAVKAAEAVDRGEQ